MESQRRKELKRQYLETKPDMGVFAVYIGDQIWIGWSKNLHAALNGMEGRLTSGAYVNQKLQRAYTANPSSFRVERLEVLAYDKDESKTDYTDDLMALQDMWIEQLPGSELLKPGERKSK